MDNSRYLISIPSHGKRGFTLIELSLVLVIIGLLVGGVMTGQYIFEMALMNKEISAIQRYATAMTTFKLKYNYLPGDLPAATNFFPVLFNGGDGNGIIQSNGNPVTQIGTNAGAFEFMAVNTQLAYAGLINQKTYDETSVLSGVQGKIIFDTPTKSGLCAFGGGANTENLLRLGCWGSTTGYGINSSSIGIQFAYYINAPRAYVIDVKLDDGLPRAGKIVTSWRPRNYGTTPDVSYVGCVNLVSGIYYYNITNESYATGVTSDPQGCPLYLYGFY